MGETYAVGSKAWVPPNAGKKFFCAGLSISALCKMYRFIAGLHDSGRNMAFYKCCACVRSFAVHSVGGRWRDTVCPVEGI